MATTPLRMLPSFSESGKPESVARPIITRQIPVRPRAGCNMAMAGMKPEALAETQPSVDTCFEILEVNLMTAFSCIAGVLPGGELVYGLPKPVCQEFARQICNEVHERVKSLPVPEKLRIVQNRIDGLGTLAVQVTLELFMCSFTAISHMANQAKAAAGEAEADADAAPLTRVREQREVPVRNTNDTAVFCDSTPAQLHRLNYIASRRLFLARQMSKRGENLSQSRQILSSGDHCLDVAKLLGKTRRSLDCGVNLPRTRLENQRSLSRQPSEVKLKFYSKTANGTRDR